MSTVSHQPDTIIIGAGFYGLRVALHLRESLGHRVTVLEERSEPMLRASRINQARVHFGYHYPRSILTGFRSRADSRHFVEEFAPAIADDVEHHYAIARRLSKTSAAQFKRFCERIGAPVEAASSKVTALFSRERIEAVFRVHEPAFDAVILRELLLERIKRAGGIEIRTSTPVLEVRQGNDGRPVAVTPDGDLRASSIVNAGYAGIAALTRRSGLPPLPLEHELTELALVRPPSGFPLRSVTVMDGPFFSVMPYPSRALSTLSHVRYTPHRRWREGDPDPATPESAFHRMRADAARFVPALRGLEYVESIWETKTLLTESAESDSRPILYRKNHGVQGYSCILGGKLDNVYDVLDELTGEHASE